MTLMELKSRVLFQYNADEDDLEEYEPAITGYINDGYDQLLDALLERHTGPSPFPVLEFEADTPKLPDWTHSSIADYATWLCYRNGNQQKQSRGQRFLESFLEMLNKLKSMRASASYDSGTGDITIDDGNYPQFFNVYP